MTLIAGLKAFPVAIPAPPWGAASTGAATAATAVRAWSAFIRASSACAASAAANAAAACSRSRWPSSSRAFMRVAKASIAALSAALAACEAGLARIAPAIADASKKRAGRRESGLCIGHPDRAATSARRAWMQRYNISIRAVNRMAAHSGRYRTPRGSGVGALPEAEPVVGGHHDVVDESEPCRRCERIDRSGVADPHV